MKKNLLAIISFLIIILISFIIKNRNEYSIFDSQSDENIKIIENRKHFRAVDFDLNTGFKLMGDNEDFIVKTTDGYLFQKDIHEMKESLNLKSNDEFWWKPSYSDSKKDAYIVIYKMNGQYVKNLSLVKIVNCSDGGYVIDKVKEKNTKKEVTIDEIEKQLTNSYEKFLEGE